jgi:hypothetical protein
MKVARVNSYRLPILTGPGGLGGADQFASPTGDFLTKNEGAQDFISAHGATGSTETFDPTDGNVHTATLDDDCAFTLNAPVGTGACTLELQLTQDGTGGWVITWPGTVTVIGTLDTTADTTSIVIVQTLDGGTSWVAVVVGGGGSSGRWELAVLPGSPPDSLYADGDWLYIFVP